ncbi:hypothetical protein DFJ73DRAFT_859584 [Zopfochytrium polystomum]|nr:hypothetical protein DFJ73DRAFT_859584 [Zopfochytrium polystomum]
MRVEKERVKLALVRMKGRLRSSKNPGGEEPTAEYKAKMRALYQRYQELKAKLEQSTIPAKQTQKQPRSASQDGFREDFAISELIREKRALQIALHQFQHEFELRYGRPISNAKDRAPMEKEYQRYQELRLIVKAGAGAQAS